MKHLQAKHNQNIKKYQKRPTKWFKKDKKCLLYALSGNC